MGHEQGPDKPDAPPLGSEGTLRQSPEEIAGGGHTAGPRRGPPREVPGFSVREKLGEGAFGEVWRAVEHDTSRAVAIKFFKTRGGPDITMLRWEVEKLLKVQSERRVVQLYKVGWESDPPYYVMEYLEGGSLSDRLSGGPLAVDQAVSFARQIAKALSFLHEKGVVHCDLKPGNVLVDQRGQLRLADFGQSRLTGEEEGPLGGTLLYMAPEQTERARRPDTRADIYSLGALLFEMLVGRPPLAQAVAQAGVLDLPPGRERLKRYREVVAAGPAPSEHRRQPGVDGLLERIVDKCLAPNPADRFESVYQVLEALDLRTRRSTLRPAMAIAAWGALALVLSLGSVGLWARAGAKRDSANLLEQQVLGDARATAEIVAAAIDYQLMDARQRIALSSMEPAIRRSLEELRRLIDAQQRTERPSTHPPIDGALEAFRADPSRWLGSDAVARLEVGLGQVFQRLKDRGFHSLVVADSNGFVLARVPERGGVVGQWLWFREWFTGEEELRPEEAVARPGPRQSPGITKPFRSRADGSMMIAVAAPIQAYDDDATAGRRSATKPLGVLAATLTLDQLSSWIGNGEHVIAGQCPERFSVLLARGVVLRHPCRSEKLSGQGVEVGQAYLSLASGRNTSSFRDPLRPEGEQYFAALAPLRQHAQWFVAVERDRTEAMRPIESLSAGLTWAVMVGFSVGVLVVGLIGGFLWRVWLRGVFGPRRARPSPVSRLIDTVLADSVESSS